MPPLLPPTAPPKLALPGPALARRTSNQRHPRESRLGLRRPRPSHSDLCRRLCRHLLHGPSRRRPGLRRPRPSRLGLCHLGRRPSWRHSGRRPSRRRPGRSQPGPHRRAPPVIAKRPKASADPLPTKLRLIHSQPAGEKSWCCSSYCGGSCPNLRRAPGGKAAAAAVAAAALPVSTGEDLWLCPKRP